jgi:hypothetical protein
MLLIHKKNFSSPLASTLTPEAIFSEAKRWVWSFVCAFLNKRHNNYKVYFFENIKADPSHLLKEISSFINVNLSPIKIRVLNKPLKIGMMGITPSIDFFVKDLSGNKPGSTVDAYKLTLNQCEIKEILLIFNQFPNILYEKELFFLCLKNILKT